MFPARVLVFAQSSGGPGRELTKPNEPYTGLTGIDETVIIEDFLRSHWPYMRMLSAKDWRNS